MVYSQRKAVAAIFTIKKLILGIKRRELEITDVEDGELVDIVLRKVVVDVVGEVVAAKLEEVIEEGGEESEEVEVAERVDTVEGREEEAVEEELVDIVLELVEDGELLLEEIDVEWVAVEDEIEPGEVVEEVAVED